MRGLPRRADRKVIDQSSFGIRESWSSPAGDGSGGIRATYSLNKEFPVRLSMLTNSSTLAASSARALAGGC
jgi:hypothetical protein